MTDQQAIQTILSQVHAGELSIEEAADRLIAIEHSETLDSLIRRLGSPPDDIVAAWCEQLLSIASVQAAIDGEPLPKIDLTQWAVTADGRLLLNQIRLDDSDDEPPMSEVSLDRIAQFRSQFQSHWNPASQRAPTSDRSAATGSVDAPPEAAQRSDDRDAERLQPRAGAAPKTTPRIPRIVRGATATIAMGAVVVIGLWFRPSTDPPESIAPLPSEQALTNESLDPQSTIDDAQRPIDGVDPPNVTIADADDHLEIVTLESFAPTAALDSREELEQELSMLGNVRAPSLELGKAESGSVDRIDLGNHRSTSRTERTIRDQDRTNPGPENSKSMHGEPEQAEPKSAEPTQSAPNPPSAQPALDEPTDRVLIPAESPQTVRRSHVMSIQLPQPNDVDTSVTLSDRPLTGLRIGFPYPVPVEVTAREGQWSILDTEQNVPLAVIRTGTDGSKFSWTETTHRTSSRSALVHGRLIDALGRRIYLRPKFESEPWSFQLDRPDWLLTWDLESTIAAGVTHLDVLCHLPDDLECDWVDPIDPVALRREQGTAVIRTKDDQDIALAVRFDIRCHRKLHVRIRFAARLDRAMSWQRVSSPLLDQFHDQLFQQAAMLANETERLAKVYRSLHRRSEQSFIRDKQARVKELGKQNQLATLRVAELQTLMLRLESQAQVGFRVWVAWPDAQQTILSAMRPVEMEGTSGPAIERMHPK